MIEEIRKNAAYIKMLKELIIVTPLVENNVKFQQYCDELSFIVWSASASGSVSYVNKFWCDFTGLSLEESLGDGWLQATDPLHTEEMAKVWIEAWKHGKEYQHEGWIISKDNITTKVIYIGIPVFEKGEKKCFIGIDLIV